jgi:hypothetical protein
MYLFIYLCIYVSIFTIDSAQQVKAGNFAALDGVMNAARAMQANQKLMQRFVSITLSI